MKSIFKTFFLSLCIIANTHFAYGQTASILPPAKTMFFDSNGKPLTSGTVDFYLPSTTTRKTTWQNSGETVANTNPVVLDAAGRAIIYGDGAYRQVVKDRLGNLIWDAITSSTGTGGGSTTATGDGDLVGTIKPWAGLIAPNQYAFTYGQELSRSTYATLFTAITSSQTVFCTSGSPILTGLSDTTNFPINSHVEVSCIAAGNTTIISKTSSSVTMAVNANVSTNTTAIIFPWGNGNHTTTFNVPDLRGFVIAGNNNMGGVSSPNLTTTYFGSDDPNSIGGSGGSQSKTLDKSNIPTITATNPATAAVTVTSTLTSVVSNTAGITSSNAAGGGNGQLNSNTGIISAITSTGTTAINAINTISNAGGIAVSATIAAVGSGYTNGAQTITVAGGTCTTQPQFTVTVSGNIFTSTPALLTAGSCTVVPTNPVATTGGGGAGGTLNVSYSSQAFSTVQPTRTANYIIKITPDSNSATASGVTSLGGMTGDIACGTGLTCTGNIISSGTSSLIINSSPITGGTTKGLLYDFAGVLGNLATANNGVLTTDSSGNPSITTSIALNGATSGVAGEIKGLNTQNGFTSWTLKNLSNGAAASTAVTIGNDLATADFEVWSSLFSLPLFANRAGIIAGNALDGLLFTTVAAKSIDFAIANTKVGSFTTAGVLAPLNGIAVTGTNDTTNTQNSGSAINITNASPGVGAAASFAAGNGTNSISFGIQGLNKTPFGMFGSNTAFIVGTADFNIGSLSGKIGFGAGGSAEQMRLATSGGLSVGTSIVTTDPGAGSIAGAGGFQTAPPTTKTANYTQLTTDYSLIFNGAGSLTLTLLAAATYPGKQLLIKTIAAQTVISNASNVVPQAGGAAGTAILAGTAGKWAILISDGTSWQIMASN